MALLHEATIKPTKDQLIGPWLRTRPWWDGHHDRGPVGTFRLDDAAGEVGIECFLMGSPAGSTLFVPVTYRGRELAGAEQHLIGTMEHSVLGTRWVYDAAGDPVFVATVLDTIRSGGTQAEMVVRAADGSEQVRDPATTAEGSGHPVPVHDPGAPVAVEERDDRTVVRAGDTVVTVARRLGPDAADGPSLTGTFAGGSGLVLVSVG